MLELADREFSSLTEEIEQYALDVEEKAQAGKLAKVEVNSASVDQFLRHKLSTVAHSKVEFAQLDEKVIGELKALGITTLDKLDLLLSEEIISKFSRHNTTSFGLLRDAMMYHDIDRYFADAWNNHWGAFDMDSSYSVLLEKYGEVKLNGICEKHEIMLVDPYEC